MKLSKRQKQMKMGVQLLVNLNPKSTNYELVDGFFYNRLEAERYAARRYPNLRFRTRGLRLNCEPVTTRSSYEV